MSPAHTLSQDTQGCDHTNDTEGDIDIENPAPGKIFGDDAAKRGADADSKSHNYGIHTKRPSALMSRESTGKHCGADRHDECTTQALQCSCSNQHAK